MAITKGYLNTYFYGIHVTLTEPSTYRQVQHKTSLLMQKLTLLLLALALANLHSHSQNVEWVKTGGAPIASDGASGLTVDKNNNLYVYGRLGHNSNLGPATIDSFSFNINAFQSFGNAFIAKYNKHGHALNAFVIPNSKTIRKCIVANDLSIYMLLDSVYLQWTYPIVAKIDQNGSRVWTHFDINQGPNDIALTNNGDLLIATTKNYNPSLTLLEKDSGNVVVNRTYPRSDLYGFQSIAVDNKDFVYATSSGNSKRFFKISATGIVKDSLTLSHSLSSKVHYHMGKIYTVFHAGEKFVIRNDSLYFKGVIGQNSWGSVVSQIDSDFVSMKHKILTGFHVNALAIAPNKDILCTGNGYDTVHIESDTIVLTNYLDYGDQGMVFSLDKKLNKKWWFIPGERSIGTGIQWLNGKIFVAGRIAYGSSGVFGDKNTSNAESDFYLAKLNGGGTHPLSRTVEINLNKPILGTSSTSPAANKDFHVTWTENEIRKHAWGTTNSNGKAWLKLPRIDENSFVIADATFQCSSGKEQAIKKGAYVSNITGDTAIVNVLSNCGYQTSCSADFYLDSVLTTKDTIVIRDSSKTNWKHVEYLWIFGDGDSSTQAFPNHTYPNKGTYNLCLIIQVTNGSDTLYCTDSICKILSIDSVGPNGFTIAIMHADSLVASASISETPSKAPFSIFPNPSALSTTSLTYNGGPDVFSLKVFDITGQLVMDLGSMSFMEPGQQIPIRIQDPGTYIVTIQNDSQLHSLRFIKY